jgi:two-component system, chemotaxis family, protein-glutamate methylesterase/glutaminase
MPAEKPFILAIGTSAGGTIAVPDLISQLHKEMNIAVFVVIHLTKRSIGEMFVKRVQQQTTLKCKIPRHGEAIKGGYIYFAKPDHHLLVKNNKIALGKGPMENRYRPSIDALFRSAAAEFDHLVIGVILTGMLEDGAAGMLAIKRSGGRCIVQEPDEAQFPGMPQAAIKNIKPDYILPVAEMGHAISEMIAAPPRQAKIPDDIKKEADISQRVLVGIERLSKISDHSLFSCPDCGGGLWRFDANGETRYRCHVGHAYSEDGLLAAMEVSTESALWTAIRIIEEKRNLLKALADKEKKNGSKNVVTRYRQRVKELEIQIEHLKTVLFATQLD